MNTVTEQNSLSSKLTPVHVLIVDDSIHDYRSLSMMVGENSSNTYSFEWARNSEEAELKLESSGFEIVAVDYNLGLEIGSEVIGRLSKRYPNSAYIMVTGNQDPEVYKEGIRAGAVNFVQKTKDCGAIFDRMAQYAIERNRSETSLKMANASKDWLMSILETDLATPLFTLNQQLANASKEAQNMPKEMLIELIETAYQTSCETLLASKDLLEWGRSIRGAIQPIYSMVDVSELVQRSIRLLTALADEREIYLAKQGVFAVRAYCDERMLSTILRNLLITAVHFSANAKHVLINADVEGQRLAINIKAEGRGIDASDFANLFRANQGTEREANTIDRRAITSIQVASHMLDSMGCELQIRNNPKSGVLFSFTLPLNLPSDN